MRTQSCRRPFNAQQCQRNVRAAPAASRLPVLRSEDSQAVRARDNCLEESIEAGVTEEPALPPPVRSVAPVHANRNAASASSAAAAIRGTRPDPLFPERMKANKILAGRVCPGCAKEIDLGDEVYNCQTCHGTMHYACHDAAKCCKNPSCPTALELVSLQKPKHGRHRRRECPAEKLRLSTEPSPARTAANTFYSSAKKCRFCSEYLNKEDRDRKAKLTTVIGGRLTKLCPRAKSSSAFCEFIRAGHAS